MAASTRTCADCGAQPVTAIIDGSAVCDPCLQRRAAAALPGPPPVDDPLETFAFDDEDDEQFFQDWEEAEREAATLLGEGLPEAVAADPPGEALGAAVARIRAGVADRGWPYRHIAAAAGWGRIPPADDRELWVSAAGALVSMREDSGLGAEAEASIISLELGDWLGAVLGLVRAGAGAPGTGPDLVRYIDDAPEVDGEVDPEDADLVTGTFELVLPFWEAVGALDADHRLTPLGWWGLPRALAWAWHAEIDGPG